MPQFDFTTYSSQIFWLSLCFALLYFCSSKIILPRIHKILHARKNLIDADLLESRSIEKKLNEFEIKTDALRKAAIKDYQAQIEAAVKHTNQQKEKMAIELKEKVEAIIAKSTSEIKNFVTESKAKRDAAVVALVNSIKAKILKN